LQRSPDAITAYVRRHRLRHVEDDSNADRRFARNRLRIDVWPVLCAAFPQAEGSLAVAARWAHEAQECADELAAIDLARIADAKGLVIAEWAALAPARRSNALRAWLKAGTGAAAAAATVERLLAELPARAPAQWLVGGSAVRRYRGRLTCRAEALPEASPQPAKAATLCLTRAGTYSLPGWGGRLRVQRVDEGGLPMAVLRDLHLVERQGGERFQAAPGQLARSLKKQFQSAAVPAWERQGPLVYGAGHLLYVPGLGVDARALAARGVRQASLVWLPDAC
jgi:tRNA(Ile)-lysidine synthase